MNRTIKRSSSWGALGVTLAICLATTVQAQSITFIGSTTNSDYSNTGLGIGTAGFWFANFDAPTANSGSTTDTNEASSLPSWVSIDHTPDTTFAGTSTTSGGQGWATLTLPDGTTGESGALVDSNTANNSNNTIRELHLGPGTPSRFYFHIVTDNTAGEHDPASRLRARAEDPPFAVDISGPNVPSGLAANMNGTPDVYTWLYEGLTDTAFIKVQLNSGNALENASIAGFMFDVVPEPASCTLLIMGLVALGWSSRRRG